MALGSPEAPSPGSAERVADQLGVGAGDDQVPWAVVAALERCQSAVVVAACRAIELLAAKPEHRKAGAVVRERGLRAVVQALRRQPRDQAVQEAGTVALLALAGDDGGCAVPDACGVTECVVHAMQAHYASLPVQLYGCFVLAKLAEHPANARARGRDAQDVLEAGLTALPLEAITAARSVSFGPSDQDLEWRGQEALRDLAQELRASASSSSSRRASRGRPSRPGGSPRRAK